MPSKGAETPEIHSIIHHRYETLQNKLYLHMDELLWQQSSAAVGRDGERVPLRRDAEEVEVSQAGDDAARVQDRLEDERTSYPIGRISNF